MMTTVQRDRLLEEAAKERRLADIIRSQQSADIYGAAACCDARAAALENMAGPPIT